MKKLFFLLSILIYHFSYSQCSFPTSATQNGVTRNICVNNPLQTESVSNVRGNNYVSLNIVQGFTYNFSVENVFTSSNENLDLFDSANVNIGFSSGSNGTTITNWVAPFSGEIKIVLSLGSCQFTDTTNRNITITLVSTGNTLDNPNVAGTNTWIGHVYNWSGVTPPPGGTSPTSPANTFPFTAANYLGYYNINNETITENFGGDNVCFPVLSNGTTRTNVRTETYAVRYKMRSTRPAGCYIASFRGDDGIRLYVDNQLVFNEWVQQSPTQYFNVFIYLDGDSDIILDYYENGGQNVVEFNLTNFDTNSNSISLIGNSQICNNVAPGFIDGSEYVYRGTTINPTINFQWQVSTDNITFTNIPGATLENYSPPATPTAGFRYFRRIVSAAANAASCNYPSNVITIETSSTVSPTPPTITLPTNTNCDRFTANWTPVAGATSYLLYVSTNNSFTSTIPGYNGINVGNTTSYPVTGLTYNTTYYYRIQAVTSCSSSFSTTATFLFLDRPSTPTMNSISCNSFTINWGSTVRADSYEIDVSTVSNFTNFVSGYNNLNVGNVTSYTLTGLPVNSIIYFRVRAVNSSCGRSAYSNTSNNSTSWNGSNWSNGFPNLSRFVIINGNYNMNTLPSFNACNVQVNNGFTLTVSDSKNITVENNINVNTTASLLVENNGSIVQISNSGTNTGNIRLLRAKQMRLSDYVYWSSPVSGFAITSLSTNTPNGFVFNWNPTVMNPNGGQGNWQNANEIMVSGKGYAVRGPNGFNNSSTQNFVATFTGVPNNGIINYTIQKGSNIGAGSVGPNGILRTVNDDNWNLIGNPYPSAISAMSFLMNNPDIDGNIRIWSSTNLPSNSVSNPFYNNFSYNYNPNDYIVHNGTATTSGPNTFDGNIASGQGFMVMMNESSPSSTSSIIFNNAMRNNTFSNSQFYRNNNQSEEKHRVWLDLLTDSQNTISSRIVIGYVDGATNSKDRLFDAITDYKMAQNFYSILNEDILCIQGKELPFDSNDIIPLGFKTSYNGNHKIAIAAIDGVFKENQDIYLEDKLLNITHDLKQNPYLFTSNSGIFNERFYLKFKNSTLSSPNFNNNIISIYNVNNKINIKSEDESIYSYEIFDILGRKIMGESNLALYNIEIEIPKSNQSYILKIKLTSDDKLITKKIIH